MPTYRLYTIDQYSGHFNAVDELHAPDDVGAIRMVQQMDAEVPRELWLEGRKVRGFDPNSEMAGYRMPPSPLGMYPLDRSNRALRPFPAPPD
jgi:hypothetical protein